MDHQEEDREFAADTVVGQASRGPSPNGTLRDNKMGSVVEIRGTSNDMNGGNDMEIDADFKPPRPARYRPRTFPYQHYLPYQHTDNPLVALAEITKCLYIAVSSGDFVPGATHWTRELRAWVQLKFDLPRDDRVKLAKLYYELALAPGMDSSAAERFGSMFMTLTRYDTPIENHLACIHFAYIVL